MEYEKELLDLIEDDTFWPSDIRASNLLIESVKYKFSTITQLDKTTLLDLIKSMQLEYTPDREYSSKLFTTLLAVVTVFLVMIQAFSSMFDGVNGYSLIPNLLCLIGIILVIVLQSRGKNKAKIENQTKQTVLKKLNIIKMGIKRTTPTV